MGAWKWSAGEFNGGDASDKAIQTSEDARFYGLSAKLNEAFTNKDKELVIQMSVKHEQDLDCGGAYIKLMGDIDQSKFGGDTPYQIMFGPDVCGPSNRKTHVIFNYPPKNDNLLSKDQVKVETDRLSHLYTLVVKPDNTYDVLIDLESVKSGTLESNWDFLLPKEIKDPAVSKPADWVDKKKIPDPEDVKPAGYDDVPKEIPDAEASRPDDWDDEEDGEWEAPMVPNPDYKGPWKPKMIPNPEYKGEWVHPMVPNPDYIEDKELHVRCKDCTHIGFELWQVKSGTMFDDIIVTDSLEEAKAYAAETFSKKRGPEKEAFDAAEKVKADAAAAAAAEASAAGGGDAEDEEEEDHDEL
jgi:calreticulin